MMNKYMFQAILTGCVIGMLPIVIYAKVYLTKIATWKDLMALYSSFALIGLWFVIVIAIMVSDLRKK